MRGISIRAILIANVAASVISVFVIVLAVLTTIIIALFVSEDLAMLPAKFNELRTSQLYEIGVAIAAAASGTLSAGYIAGRLAGNRFLSHGLMATVVWTLILTGTNFLFPDPPDSSRDLPALLNVIVTLGGLFLGVVGGHLAEKRELQLAALPLEQRAALSFRSRAYTVLGWMLAFPMAALAYVASLKVMLAIGGLSAVFPFAVVFAVWAGTAAVRSSQRTIAAYVFMSLAILIPAEELIRHALHGGLRHFHGFLLVLNIFGAAMAYQTLQTAFPAQFGPIAGSWWWLSWNGYARWTDEERHARRGLSVVAGVAAIVLFSAFEGTLRMIGVDTGLSISFELLLASVFGLWLARPIYSKLYPREIEQADANAAWRSNSEVRRGLKLRKVLAIVASTVVVIFAIALVSS